MPRSYAARVRDAATDQDLVDSFLVHVRAGRGVSDTERMLVDDLVADVRVAEVRA